MPMNDAIPPPPLPEPPAPATPPHLEAKATLLLVALVLMVGAAALYLSYARGAFEATQTLVLVADDSEGVSVGMDITFAGFPVGRVRRTEQIVLVGQVPPEGTTVKWALTRMEG